MMKDSNANTSPAAHKVPATRERPPAKDQVLVVDDNPENIAIMALRLNSAGYETIHALNGVEAITVVRECRPQAILLDVMMPGLDGFEVTRILKGDPRTRDIPVILVTALSSASCTVKGLNAGADDFLAKPVSPAELLARVRAAVSLHKLQTTLREKAIVQGACPVEETLGPAARPQTILIIEDNERTITGINALLEANGYRTATARSGRAALDFLAKMIPDLILLDLFLPDTEGLTLLAQLKSNVSLKRIPVIIVSAQEGTRAKVDGLNAGADDYLVKPVDPDMLMAKIRATLRKNRGFREPPAAAGLRPANGDVP